MNAKKLEAFVKVVELRSFSDAAQAVGLTQSGMSKQIRSLEEDLGVTLLHRTTASVELTPAGRIVYSKAHKLLRDWEQLMLECGRLAAGSGGLLRIGASTVPSTSLLPELLQRLRSAQSALEFTVATGSSGEMLEQLEQQELDAIIVGMAPNEDRFSFLPLIEDKLLVIGNESFRNITTLPQIVESPLIIREQGSGTLAALEQALSTEKLSLSKANVVARVSSSEAALAMARAGLGLAAVSALSLSSEALRSVTVLYELPTNRKFYAVCLRNRAHDPAIKLFFKEADRLRNSFT
ncbi:selenium metabolism-associated LysR family transcriptional regulator [Paenibacillus turpanensis]|uniref:selenium metabolism-associated LysR family transcriptional regulator n=1 Tax=Paenibacillus turpanensis TaxID=2689078 RepID=UPI001409A892|nr:selenium metabolism-associated LysR family transcriptional regulator [Paenibacillus turpanensis]